MMLYDHAGGLTQNMQIIPMPRVVDGLQQRHQCIAVAALPKNIKHKKTFNPFLGHIQRLLRQDKTNIKHRKNYLFAWTQMSKYLIDVKIKKHKTSEKYC